MLLVHAQSRAHGSQDNTPTGKSESTYDPGTCSTEVTSSQAIIVCVKIMVKTEQCNRIWNFNVNSCQPVMAKGIHILIWSYTKVTQASGSSVLSLSSSSNSLNKIHPQYGGIVLFPSIYLPSVPRKRDSRAVRTGMLARDYGWPVLTAEILPGCKGIFPQVLQMRE